VGKVPNNTTMYPVFTKTNNREESTAPFTKVTSRLTHKMPELEKNVQKINDSLEQWVITHT